MAIIENAPVKNRKAKIVYVFISAIKNVDIIKVITNALDTTSILAYLMNILLAFSFKYSFVLQTSIF